MDWKIDICRSEELRFAETLCTVEGPNFGSVYRFVDTGDSWLNESAADLIDGGGAAEEFESLDACVDWVNTNEANLFSEQHPEAFAARLAAEGIII